VILVGEGADVLYAQQEDGHEEGCHRCGSSLKCLSMVFDLFDLLLSIGNHVFVVGLFKFKGGWSMQAVELVDDVSILLRFMRYRWDK